MKKMLAAYMRSSESVVIYRTFLAIFFALAVSVVLVFGASEEPLRAMREFLLGPISRIKFFSNILEKMIPILFAALALSLVFRSRHFSLFIDGAFFIGSVVAAWFGINLLLPAVIHPALAFVAAGLVGGCVGLIPAILKIKWQVSELVSSLMLNYIMMFLGIFIVKHSLRDLDALVFASKKFAETFRLAVLIPATRLHTGFLLAVIATVLLSVFIDKSKWGYEIRLVGGNINFARFSGINSARVILYSHFIAGFVAAVGGAVEISGMYSRFIWNESPGYGWDGVIVALLGKNNPKFIPLSAFFLAYLRIGADLMSRRTDIDSQIIYIIQAVMIMFIASEMLLAGLKARRESREALRFKREEA